MKHFSSKNWLSTSVSFLGLFACAGPSGDSQATGVVRQALQVCGQFDTVNINGKEYVVQNDEWNSSASQCLTVNDTSVPAFSVATNQNLPTNGPPASYPSVFKGCHWGNCTTNSGMPIQLSALGSSTSSWSTTQQPSGAYDVAYDIWFNSTPTTGGQPDGTELMIWINKLGSVQPGGSMVASNVSLAGATWNVWFATVSGSGKTWNYVAYQRTSGTTSVSNLDLKAFFSDGATRGYINRSHYVIAIEAGFEIWQGGNGLATNSFNASVSSGGGGTGGTNGTGGSSTGGKATGGSSTGGKATGGSSTGGKATGGSSGSAPCSGLCSSPTVFAGPSYSSGNLGTAATCHQTTASLAAGNCGNFANGRTLTVNGTQMPCNNGNWASLPAKRNGGFCIQTTAGDYAWAYFATW